MTRLERPGNPDVEVTTNYTTPVTSVSGLSRRRRVSRSISPSSCAFIARNAKNAQQSSRSEK